MKRLLYILLSALFLAVSCQKHEIDIFSDSDESEESLGRVDITFSVAIPSLNSEMETNPTTKALSNTPDIKHLYVAVFGSSGYLKEYVKANPVELATTNAPDRYSFTVNIALGTGKRSVHLIANGPTTLDFGTDKVILPKLTTTNATDAYWQMIDLPNGITAKKHSGASYVDSNGQTVVEGDFIDINDNKITNGRGYLPSEETVAAFNPVETYTLRYQNEGGTWIEQSVTYTGIQLIRNFAKITVEASSTSHFTLKSFAVINAPMQGTVVPYNFVTGEFIRHYHALSYSDLYDTEQYEGRIPFDVTFQTLDVRPLYKLDFENYTNGVVQAGSTAAIHFYERPVPTGDNATCVIVYGHYTPADASGGTEGDYFYKVDLMEHAEYYPIYRNFKYQVKIRNISKEGATTPLEAYNSAGSGDVSADQNASELGDISDGIARLEVGPYMLRTITGSEVDRTIGPASGIDNPDNQYFELKYRFVADITDSDSICNGPTALSNGDGTNPGKGYVVVAVENKSAEVGVIKNNEVHFIKKYTSGSTSYYIIDEDDIGEDGDDGFRSILFKSYLGSESTKNQKITITGHYDHEKGTGKLYRNITLSLISKQTMTVRCVYPRILHTKGQQQAVEVTIPRGLPKSMFPLTFAIESSANSLTPNNSVPNNNLPVESGRTIALDNNGNQKTGTSYHYNKTLTYEDYTNLPGTASTATWTAYFYTNKTDSDCRVFVAQEYFNTAYDDFVTYQMKNFTDLHYVNGVPRADEQKVTFEFNMHETQSERPGQVKVRLTGLVPDSADFQDELTTWDTSTGTYIYTPAPNNRKGTLHLLTNVDDANVRVDLVDTDEYYDAYMVPKSITGVSLDNTYHGVGSTTTFRFTFPDADSRNNTVLTLVGLEPVNSAGLERLGTSNRWQYTTTPTSNSMTVALRTTTATGAIRAGVVSRDCKSESATANRTKKTFASLTVGKAAPVAGAQCTISFKYQNDQPAEAITVEFTNLGGATPTSTTGTLTHQSGNFWTYMPNNATANATHVIRAYATDASSGTGVQLSAAESYNSISASGTRGKYVFKSLNVSSPRLGDNQTSNITFEYEADAPAMPITIALTGMDSPVSTTGTLTPGVAGTWTYTPNSADPNQTHTIVAYANTFGTHVTASLSDASYDTKNSGNIYRTLYIAAQRLSLGGERNNTIQLRLGGRNNTVLTSFTCTRYFSYSSYSYYYSNPSDISYTFTEDVSSSRTMYFTRSGNTRYYGTCTLEQIVNAYSGSDYSLTATISYH